MFETIGMLREYHVMEICFVLSILLVLIDYFFPTDWPAFVGYVLFAVGMFFLIPTFPLYSLLIAVATFVILLLLHMVLFRRFLTNAPGTESKR